jgi:hypothetical protein
MRKHLATVVFVAGLVACSSDIQRPIGPASSAPGPAISDAANGGREGFYFLHPLVTNPGVAGPFDASLAPRIRVCALDATRTTCSVVITGTSSLTVDPTNGVFTGQWSTLATLALTTPSGSETRYRLEILVDVGGRTVILGYADLWIVAQQRDAKETPAGYVDLVQGKMLLIRFGVLRGTVGYVVVTPDPTEVAIGGTQQMTATAFDLHNAIVTSALFAWSSNNSDVAAVSSAGLATGLTNGSTNINAKTGGVTGSAVINVVGDPPVAPTAVADEPAAESVPGDAFHTAFNTALSSGGTTPHLLTNDVLGSPPATVVSYGGGALGGSAGDHAAGTSTSFGSGGSLQVNGDGSFTFTPGSGFTGAFSFSYRIQNSSGPSDALVMIAVGVRPAASHDIYPVTIIGNVSINTASSSHFSLLSNDAGDGLSITLGASPNGDATINPDGTFTFNPSPGFTGTATVSYTVQNGFGPSAPAAVSIPVTTPIWFVDAAAAAGGDGRLGTPFNCLVDAGSACYDDSANEAGDFIYVGSGTYANADAMSLKASQRVIGQGATSSLPALTGLVNAADSPPLPSTGGVAPLISSAAAGVVLATENQLHGFNVGNTVGAGLSGTDFGTLTVRNVNFPGPTRSGQALGLTNGTLAAGSTFASMVSTSGAVVAVSLTNVAGSLVVTGGTISNTTGAAAIALSNMAVVSLSNLLVKDNAGNGIAGTNVAGFALSQSTVQNNGDAASEANIRMTGLTGTVNLTSNTISNASGDNVLVDNTAGSLVLSLANSTLSNSATKTDALNGLSINAAGTAVVNASIQNNTLQGHRLAHLRTNSTGSARVTVSVVGNTMECGNAIATGCNASFISSSDESFTYNILSNIITGVQSAVALHKTGGTGGMSGSFSNNSIGASDVAGSGGDGVSITSQANGVSHTTSVVGNSIRGYRLYGMDLSADLAGILNATVTANILEQPDASAQHGVRVSSGIALTSTATVCLALNNNIMTGSGPVSDFRLAQGGLATMFLPGYGGAKDDNAAVVAFVGSIQALAASGTATNSVAGGGGGFLGGSACSTPE